MVTFVDTTLRDGEQSPGIAFTIEDKVRIALALSSVGIKEMEVGTPVMGGDEAEAVKAIVSLRLPARIFTWNRVIENDIGASLRCGVKNLYISCPVSDIQIEKKLGKTRDWVRESFSRTVIYAKTEGCYVACGLEDASRADSEFLSDICAMLDGLGVDRIRICDTVGILTPFKTVELINNIRNKVKASLEIHAHNDFGLAAANALAGVKAGASFASVTVNGIGERAGNTAFEELVMIMEKLEGINIGIKIGRLKEISRLVSRLSGRVMHEAKPIVGDGVFTHESGIHVDGVVKDPSCYEPFRPEDVGQNRKLVIGKHSGIKSVMNRFKSFGIAVDRDAAAALLPHIRKIAQEKKRNLSDRELRELSHLISNLT